MSLAPLVQIRSRSWLLPGPTNIGLIEADDGVYLVDSGNDKEAGRGILKVLRERDWKLKAIINTHSNADHIGGNRYLQENTGCEIWATLGEAAFINTPEVEASFLWGGYPYAELRSKFFMAKPSRVTTIIEAGGEREGFRFIGLRGHFFDMVGVLSPDGVFYMGDGIFGERILGKYKIPYIYDVKAYREGLARIGETKAERYIPSHGEVLEDVEALVAFNLAIVADIESRLLGILASPTDFETVLAELCAGYEISMDYGQYVLIGNTLRSFLSYLQAEGKASFAIEGNRMRWKAGGGEGPS